MFGSLGLPEIVLILVVALLIFGPKRLPEMGRTIGKGLAEFRRASTDLKRTLNTELAIDEFEPPMTPRRPPLPNLAPREPAPEIDVTPTEPPAGTTPRGAVDSEEPAATSEAAMAAEAPAVPDSIVPR